MALGNKHKKKRSDPSAHGAESSTAVLHAGRLVEPETRTQRKIKKKFYEKELFKLQIELVKLQDFLSLIPYEDLASDPVDLPPRQRATGYIRPPLSDQTFVPEVY